MHVKSIKYVSCFAEWGDTSVSWFRTQIRLTNTSPRDVHLISATRQCPVLLGVS